jgi:SHS2 domain-containing protein
VAVRSVTIRSDAFEPSYRFAEHGGEVEIELSAASEAGVFAAALAAFAELVAPDEAGEPVVRHEIELADPDRALLLVDWLDELLFLSELEQFVPSRIDSMELGGGRLQATVAGYRGRPRGLVKAVALHGLRLEEKGGAWNGRVVLDV